MLSIEISLRRIAQVREAIDGTRSAYLLRTRLHRLLLSLQKSIASELNLKIIGPCQLDVGKIIDVQDLQIVELCNVILLESAHLSQ